MSESAAVGRLKSKGNDLPKDVESLVQVNTDKINGYQSSEDDRCEHVRSELARLVHGVRAEAAVRKHSDEGMSKTLADAKGRVEFALLEQRRARHKVEVELQRVAGERALDARAVFSEGTQVQSEGLQANQEISDEIANMYKAIEQARKYRIEKAKNIVDGVEHKFSEIREAVSAEARIRLESQNTLLELFGQMGEKVQAELDNSQRERKHATDRLIDVMEAVLPKMSQKNQPVKIAGANLQDMSSKHMAASVAENQAKRPTSVSAGRESLMFSGSVSTKDTFG